MTTMNIGEIAIANNPTTVSRLMAMATMDLNGVVRHARTFNGLTMAVSRAIRINLLPVSIRMEIEDTTASDGSIGVRIDMGFKNGRNWNDFMNGRIQSTIVHTTHNLEYWGGEKIQGRLISKETLAIPYDTNQPFMQYLMEALDDQWEQALIEAGY